MEAPNVPKWKGMTPHPRREEERPSDPPLVALLNHTLLQESDLPLMTATNDDNIGGMPSLSHGMPSRQWGAVSGSAKALDRVPGRCPFPSTKEPYRLVKWAHQERTWRNTRAPLSQITTRNRPTRCAYTVTAGPGRADSCASPVPGSRGGCHVAISRVSTGNLAATHTQIFLCGAVQAGGGCARGFSLTRSLTHSILTLLSSSYMSWQTAATGVP
jgi:hypothetical protein